MTATQERQMSVEEYAEHQLTCEGCHDYDNGYLYKVPDEKLCENATSTFLVYFLVTQLPETYSVCSHRVRIAIPNEPKFYYPDVFITKEKETKYNEYVQYEPELIAEITSDETYERNAVYKLNEYIKIPSLKYYLIVHFEKHFTELYQKNEHQQWHKATYKPDDAMIDLPLLNVQLPMQRIYRNHKEIKTS
jgi:Uma2 family endonuclease